MIESETEWTSLQSQYIWYDVVYIDYYSFNSQNKIKVITLHLFLNYIFI